VNTFVQLVANGLGKGAVYALLALGFVIIFKATEVINFAHGSLVLIGGYAVYELQPVIGWAAAAAVGILGAGLAALLIERVVLANARVPARDGGLYNANVAYSPDGKLHVMKGMAKPLTVVTPSPAAQPAQATAQLGGYRAHCPHDGGAAGHHGGQGGG